VAQRVLVRHFGRLHWTQAARARRVDSLTMVETNLDQWWSKVVVSQ
jgi:hypothetical protein